MPEETLVEDQEEELLEEETSTETTTTTIVKKRLSLEEGNVYVYPVAEADQGKLGDECKSLAETAKVNLPNLKYTNGNPVDDKWRVISIVQKPEYNDEGDRTGGKLVAFVMAPNSGFASEKFLEHKGYDVGLALKKTGTGRGRAKSKIDLMVRGYGQLLQGVCFANQADAVSGTFKDGTSAAHKEEWNTLFARPGSENAHYREDNGDWKDPKVVEEKEEEKAAA